MKIGLKIVPETTFKSIEDIIQYVDFLELYAKVGHTYNFVHKVNKPVVIHCAHSGDAVNIADSSKELANVEAIHWAIELANSFKSNTIIIHPEYKDNKNCSIENIINLLKANHDPRMCIESMPYNNSDDSDLTFFCTKPAELNYVSKACNIGICIDLNHSSLAAYALKLDLKDFLQTLIKLKPSHFHIADAKYNNTKFEHFNLFDGDLDLKEIRKIIPKNASITLETPPNRKKQLKEIEFLRAKLGV